jgi:hypothetical protein
VVWGNWSLVDNNMEPPAMIGGHLASGWNTPAVCAIYIHVTEEWDESISCAGLADH